MVDSKKLRSDLDRLEDVYDEDVESPLSATLNERDKAQTDSFRDKLRIRRSYLLPAGRPEKRQTATAKWAARGLEVALRVAKDGDRNLVTVLGTGGTAETKGLATEPDGRSAEETGTVLSARMRRLEMMNGKPWTNVTTTARKSVGSAGGLVHGADLRTIGDVGLATSVPVAAKASRAEVHLIRVERIGGGKRIAVEAEAGVATGRGLGSGVRTKNGENARRKKSAKRRKKSGRRRIRRRIKDPRAREAPCLLALGEFCAVPSGLARYSFVTPI